LKEIQISENIHQFFLHYFQKMLTLAIPFCADPSTFRRSLEVLCKWLTKRRIQKRLRKIRFLAHT